MVVVVRMAVSSKGGAGVMMGIRARWPTSEAPPGWSVKGWGQDHVANSSSVWVTISSALALAPSSTPARAAAIDHEIPPRYPHADRWMWRRRAIHFKKRVAI